ncbi:MAG: ABC transporter ATP-binding protein [Acidimicrobiia bacterium]
MRTPAWLQANSSTPLRQVMAPLVRPQRGRLIRLSIAAILAGFAEAAVLVLIARIAFALTSTSKDIKVSLGPLGHLSVSVGTLIFVALGLVAVRGALQVISSVLAARTTLATVERTRRNLLHRYLAAGWPLQASQRQGRLQELVTTYTESTGLSIGALGQMAIGGFSLAALLVTALWVNAVASIAAAVAALLIGLMLRPLRAAVRRRSGRAAQGNLEFATGITELTSTLQEVRIFGVERPVRERLDGLNQRYVRMALRRDYAAASVGILYQSIALLLMVGALGVAYAAGFNRLSSLGAIILIMLRSLGYAQGLQSSLQQLYQTAPYVEALQEEERLYTDSATKHGGEPLDRVGAITFDHVSFEYDAGVPVLNDVSFRVNPGEIVGIVGPSGSGKSTLVQLLLRLREPTTGTMSVDDRDARRIAIDSWYERVTFVPQEPRLFSGTVMENIRFFRDHVDDDAVQRAAKLAHLHDDVVKWPLTYDTPVGEQGGQISGGQRQRLCIARALVENPDVMVLDEPTSSLDVRSESLIRETIADLAPNTTVFVVAHRMSTLAICDRIMVILNGAMEGFDTPAALEASNPFYREALRLSGMRD